MAQSLFRLWGQIQKIEDQPDGTIMVYGVASSGSRDGAGEIVAPEAMKGALPDYSKFPALREMHQPMAAGRVSEADVDDDGITNIAAHVVDPIAIQKVKTGVYAGFSIGGKVLKRDPSDRSIITGLKLVEISLVDSPCNPDAILSMWKAENMTEFKPEAAAVIARAKILAKAAGTQRFKDFLFEAGQELISEHLIEKGEIDPPAAEEPAAAAEPGEGGADAGAEPPESGKEAAAAPDSPEAPNGADAGSGEPDEAKEAAAEPGPDDQGDDEGGDSAAGNDEPEAKEAAEDPAKALENAIAKGEEALAAGAPPEAEDPLADLGKAAAALKGISLGDPAPEGPLAKSLWHVSRLADLLDSFACLTRCVTWEAEEEGDGSPIPGELKSAVQNLGQILSAMAQEEIAELIAALPGGDEPEIVIIYSGDECLLAERIVDLAKADQPALDAAAERLAKAAPKAPEAPEPDADLIQKAARADELEARNGELESENEALRKSLAESAPKIEKMVEGFQAQIDELKKRFEEEPLPPKTAGPAAARIVKKGEDSRGAGADGDTDPAAGLTPDEFQKALDALPEKDRGEILLRVALQNPRLIKPAA